MTCVISKVLIILLSFFFTQKASAQIVSDTIPLFINEQNTVYVTAILNHKDTLTLNFDTGCTDLILTNDVLQYKLKDSIELYRKAYPLQLGKSTMSFQVYDAALTGHGTQGRFGWNYFPENPVELDYDNGNLIVYDTLPKKVLDDNTYSKLAITWMDGLPFIETSISQNGVSYKSYFLFDTGYQRTVMLDNEELEKKKFPIHEMKEIKRVMMRGGQGNEVPVITAALESLTIGNFKLKSVPAQQVVGQKPMRNRNAHILGNEVLKRFNAVMDFKNSTVYLKPNQYWNVDYIEMKKG